jgi:hypothetical protein
METWRKVVIWIGALLLLLLWVYFARSYEISTWIRLAVCGLIGLTTGIVTKDPLRVY